ncbi:hypothetical protein TAMA11512_18850 [Selenomonas sp. TAMA-11512]|nr:hypothetical protein TAMA11512_18850 [Selenomonas sp. TAMA-11512]
MAAHVVPSWLLFWRRIGMIPRFIDLSPSEGEQLDEKEGDRDTENGGEEKSDDRLKRIEIVRDENDEVLDEEVRNVADGELHASLHREPRMKQKAAAQDISDEIRQDVADDEGDIDGKEHGEQIGEKNAVKRIYTADDEKEEKFAREKMTAYLIDDPHGRKTPFIGE